MRIAAALGVAAVAGFLLGACGGSGGSSLGPVSGATRTLADPTTTTVAVTTTAPAPPTSTPSRTITIRPQTTTTTATTTIAVTPVSTTESGGASSEDTPWGWIALVLALTGVAALVIGLWSRRRSRAASWSAHLGDLTRRTLIALDDVLTRGSVVTGQIQALAAEARALERHASDNRATAAVAQVRAGLDELAEALEADRTLRLASSPPSEEQLGYSDALIRQQVQQLEAVLRAPPPI